MEGYNILKQTNTFYLIFGIVALLFTLIFQGYNPFIWSYALPVLDLSMAYLLYRLLIGVNERKYMLSIFFWALFVRVAAVFMVSYILICYNGMPFLSFKDDYQYQEASVAIMQRWARSGWGFYDDLVFSSDTYSGFPNFSAALMTLFKSTSPLLPRLGNAVLSSITCIIAYVIVKGYTERYKARFVGIVLTVLPLTIIISAMQFKDTLLLFFIIIGLYASVSIINGKRVLLSILLLVASYIGCSFGRPAVIVPMAAALLVMIGRSFFSKHRGNNMIKIISLIAVGYILIYSYQYLNSIGFVGIDDYFDQRYYRMVDTDIQDSQAGVRNMSISDYLGAPLYILMGLFLPPPLLVSIDDTVNYSVWAVLAHYAFLPFLVIAMWKSIVKRKEYPIPFFLFLVYLFLRVGQANSLMTSFSPRQSLATLFIMYLLLPLYEKGVKSGEKIVVILSFITILAYNIVRLISHHMI